MTVRNLSSADAPKRKLNRVMVDAKKDDFYASPYTVVTRVSLNMFDPSVNSNKFYIAEIHSSNVGKGYRFYANHGRVGSNGSAKAEPFNNLDSAKSKFSTKVREKRKKGYVEVDLATVSKGSKEGQQKVNPDALKGVIDTSKIATAKSSLNTKVTQLITHIYEEANQAVSLSLTGSVKSDIRAPLGNLGINGINSSRQLLSRIADAIRRQDYYFIRSASITYYQYVPRKLPSNVRDESTWILNTLTRVQNEMDILDLYEDTLRMIPVMGLSDIDSKYMALNCDIREVLDAEILSYISHKVASTHASNHHYKLKVVNAFEINMKNAPRFDNSCGNVRKLFHGSRSANLVGILSSYLKLPHNLGSDITKTGNMFGNGIYFASDSTKSFQYSVGRFGGRNNKYTTAFLMIAEVALGNVHKVQSSHDFSKPPMGCHSVMGCKGTSLVNNEFIVYNPSQVRVRYLVEVEDLNKR